MLPSDGVSVGQPDPDAVAAVYEGALPQVYGYLLPRCGSVVVAEDLAAETFMAAVATTRQGTTADVTVPWLIGVARHKLVDHWRRQGREERSRILAGADADDVDDPWDEELDRAAVYAALARLNGSQRAALTLRYLDGFPVAEVAAHLGRSVHATETLLVRAKAALRHVYREQERHAD
jgi:RNA polymerase sigma-70 factor, ECF subfamily